MHSGVVFRKFYIYIMTPKSFNEYKACVIYIYGALSCAN